MRLDAHFAVEDGNSAVEHAQAALHFGCKVDVPWRIDNINLVAFPEASHRRRGNGDTPLLFLRHPVGGGAAVITLDGTDFVRQASTVQNTLSGGCFTGVDVGNNADISKVL